MKKKLIAILVLTLVTLGAYAGYNKYEEMKFIEAISLSVKNSSLRFMNAGRLETEDSKITYKEYFAKLEADISEVDKRILEVQTIATVRNKDVTDPVLEYLKGGQDFLRSLLSSNRKTVEHSSASERVKRSIESIKTSGSAWKYASERADEAIADLKVAAKEDAEARKEVYGVANKMKELQKKVSSILPADSLADPLVFEAVSKAFAPKDANEKTAQGK